MPSFLKKVRGIIPPFSEKSQRNNTLIFEKSQRNNTLIFEKSQRNNTPFSEKSQRNNTLIFEKSQRNNTPIFEKGFFFTLIEFGYFLMGGTTRDACGACLITF